MVTSIEHRRVSFSGFSLRVGEDCFGSFLGNHVDRHDNEEAWNLRKHRCVNYSQAFNAAYAKRRIEHGIRILVAPDLTSARSVMAPRAIFDKFSYSIKCFQI